MTFPLAQGQWRRASALRRWSTAEVRPLPLLPSIPPVDDPIAYLERELEWNAGWTEQARELYARELPPLATGRTLAFLFGVSPTLVRHMASSQEQYYRSFEIPRRNRAPRRIDAPRVALKVIQRWIHDHVLPKMRVHPAATAFMPAGGIFRNAVPHVAAANILKVDVREFFPSIPRNLVFRAFRELSFNGVVSRQLTLLVTYNDGLPQGAPTSPVLSNAVMYPVDEALGRLAIEWNSQYTRYADDITFSSDEHRFNPDDVLAVEGVLGELNLTINHRKTQIIGGGFRHVVAGVSVSRSAMAPRSKRRAWRALFHNASISPAEYAGRLDEMNGIAGFVGQYNPSLAARYRQIARRVAYSRQAVTPYANQEPNPS